MMRMSGFITETDFAMDEQKEEQRCVYQREKSEGMLV